MPLVALALFPGVPPSAEPVLLNDSAGGILELEGERRLEVRGFHGELGLRLGKDGELRFGARAIDDPKSERRVLLWLDGGTLRLEPPEGAPNEPLRLELAVAPTLDVAVEARDSKLTISGLHGDVQVKGQRLGLGARSIVGSMDLDVSEGRVEVLAAAKDVSLAGRALEVKVDNVGGKLVLELTGGTARLGLLHGDLDAEIDGTVLSANNVKGRIRLKASGGKVALAECAGGAELDLGETPLELRATKGSIAVQTEGPVQFQEHVGALRILGGSGNVRGTGASGGALEIEANDAEVHVEDLSGSTMIHGDLLDIHVSGAKADLNVSTLSSSVVIEKADAAVAVENEFGDIQVRAASKLLQVFSSGGAVTLEEISGTVQLKADGPTVDVHWSAMEGLEPSSVENSGDVRLRVPLDARCRIEAQAPRGRVETDLEGLELSEDGHSATGVLLGGQGRAPQLRHPTIQAKSGGDLYIQAALSAPASGGVEASER